MKLSMGEFFSRIIGGSRTACDSPGTMVPPISHGGQNIHQESRSVPWYRCLEFQS